MDKKLVKQIIASHKYLCIKRLILALPMYLLYMFFWLMSIPFSLMGNALIKIIDWLCGKIDSNSLFSSIFMIITCPFLLIGLFFNMIEKGLSSRVTNHYYQISLFFTDYNNDSCASVLSENLDFILFLRDFNPRGSEFFKHKSLLGSKLDLTHRDDYLFDGVNFAEIQYPILAIANSKDPVPSNFGFYYLRANNNEWEITVDKLLTKARYIIFTSSNHLSGVAYSTDYIMARNMLISSIQSRNGKHGEHIELEKILSNKSLYEKTLLVSAVQLGTDNPFVESTWLDLKTFNKIKPEDVANFISM